MKKFLLGSTAVAAAALIAGSAFAQEPNVSSGAPLNITGFYGFQAGLSLGDDGISNPTRDHDFVSTGRIQFNWAQTSDTGLTYGARIRLNLNNAGDIATNRIQLFPGGGLGGSNIFLDSDGLYIPFDDATGDVSLGNGDAYVYVQGAFGRLRAGEVGNAAGENYYLIADDKCLGGCYAGNVEGVTLGFLGVPIAQLFPEGSGGTGINYQTPNLGGFTATVSYAPVGGGRGGDVNYFSTDGDSQNIIAANVNFAGEFEGGSFNVGGSLSYEDVVGPSADHVLIYGLGAKAYFGPIGASAWYIGSDTGTNADISTLWLSGSYGFGAFTAVAGASLTWGESGSGINSSDVYALTLIYEVAPGLNAFAELAHTQFDPQGFSSVDGTALGAGLHFGF